MARPGASHSASAEFPPCLQLPRVPCGMKRKASYPPRRASKISPGHFTLFQFLDNLFQALETIFKFGQVEKLLSYCIPFLPSEYRVKTVWLRRQWSSCDPPSASREACGNPAAALRLRAV